MSFAAAIERVTPVTPDVGDRRFVTTVAIALAVHLGVLAIIFITPATIPNRTGESNGSAEGLTVELIDPSELPSAASPAAAQIQPPVQTQAEPQQQVQPEPQVEPQQQAAPPSDAAPVAPDLKPSTAEATEPPAEAPPEPAKAKAESVAPQEPVAEPKAAEKAQSNALALDELDPRLFKMGPDAKSIQAEADAAKQATESKSQKGQQANKAAKPPSSRSAESKTSSSKSAQKPNQQLSLALPKQSFDTPIDVGGRSAAVSRPEGITRSGLNDEFGRGVIKALRQTMPPANHTAELTVRFVLSANGDLVELVLVRSSGDPEIDQNVMFAVKQSNFPIPATNLTALDRQFRVTYVYH